MLTAYADDDGRLLALDCEATVDAGAYSAYPFSACLEAGQVGSILPGLYDFPHYRCRTYSVGDQQAADPALSRRGADRRLLCAGGDARCVGPGDRASKPGELRMKSLVRPEQMPFDNITQRHFDSGDYPQALRRALEADRSGPRYGRASSVRRLTAA